MVKRGEVFASEFLPKFAAQLKKEFGSGLQAALQSSQAKIIALQNSFTMLQKSLQILVLLRLLEMLQIV